MSEWKKVKLGDYCEITSSKRCLASVRSKNGIPFFCSKEIICLDKGEDFEPTGFIPEELYNDIKAKYGVPTSGDLLLTTRGTNGIPYIYKPSDKFYFADGNLSWFKNFGKELSPQYLYYWFKSPLGIHEVDAISKGTAQKAVPIDGLRRIVLLTPSLRIQNRIVEILSRYDSLIENYQKQIKLLEEAAQRLYKEWFVDLHFPGHESTNIVDGVPEGWEIVTINDVTSKITTGLNPRKNFVLGNGNNYYVTIKNMANNTIYLDDKCDKIDDEAIEKINKRSDLKTGDILFSGIGTIGRVCLIDIPTNNWNVSESVFTLRANDMVSKEFMYLLLLGTDVQNYCQAHAHGAAQKGIRMADLKAFKFSLAPREVMQDFTRIVNPYINIVSRIQSQLRLLTEARDRLLPKLMSGEIEI